METVLWVIAIVVQLAILPKLTKRAFRNYLKLTYSQEELQYLLDERIGILSIPNMDNFLYFNSIIYVFVILGFMKTLGLTAGLVSMVVIVVMIYYWMYKEVNAYINEDTNKYIKIKL